MELTKNIAVGVCLIIGAILLFIGTSAKHYGFEILAIIIIAFGVILAIFWNDLFKTKEETNKKSEEK